MKNIYLVYDFEGTNGMFYNALNPSVIKYFFNNNFLFTKEIDDSIKINDSIKLGTSDRNAFFNELKPIHISSITHELLEDNQFIYLINTGGNNEISFGISNEYIEQNTIFDFVSKKAKNLLKYPSFNLVIYTGLEHEMPFKYFKRIYISLQNNNINPSNIFIISNNYENINNNIKFLNKFGMYNSPHLNFLIYYEQLKSKANEFIDNSLSNKFVNDTHVNHTKSKKAIILNRRLHTHRKCFLSLMAYDDLIKDNFVSFDLGFENTHDDFVDIINNHSYINVDLFYKKDDYELKKFSNGYSNKIISGYSRIKQLKSSILDVHDFTTIDGRTLELDDVNLYNNSYFSLITETEFFNSWDRYTTEKILKPIQQLHPFVLLGSPKSLNYLKKYGFKTFSEFWDESYDDELIDSKRLAKVYELFKYLCNINSNEWDIMINKMLPILIYNRELLKQYSYKTEDNTIDNLKKYLQNEFIQKNTKLLQKT